MCASSSASTRRSASWSSTRRSASTTSACAQPVSHLASHPGDDRHTCFVAVTAVQRRTLEILASRESWTASDNEQLRESLGNDASRVVGRREVAHGGRSCPGAGRLASLIADDYAPRSGSPNE